MGKETRYRPLPDSAYDPRVTDMRKPFNVPAATGPQLATTTTTAPQWYNKNVRNLTPFQLTANLGVRALPFNYRRTGLIVQNKDATSTLYINWNFGADINSFALPPGGVIIEDFTCPPGELYLFATANIQAVVVETSRMGNA